MSKGRFCLAILGALLAGGVTVGVIEAVGAGRYAPPAGTMEDPELMKEHIANLPNAAFLIVNLAWAVGAVVTGAVGRLLAERRSPLPAVIACFVLWCCTILMLFQFSGPWWMWVLGLAAWPVGGIIGMLLIPNTKAGLQVETTRQIDAPVETVFRTLSTPEEYTKAVPEICKLEFLSDQRSGPGTRFNETRMMCGKECANVLEIAEQKENESIRMVSEAGGAVWDTTFTVSERDGGTQMTMVMDAVPQNAAAKLMAPMFMGACASAVEGDMDAVKKFCEQQGK